MSQILMEYTCLTDLDRRKDHFACDDNEIIFVSREEYDSFTENQLISFDQQTSFAHVF